MIIICEHEGMGWENMGGQHEAKTVIVDLYMFSDTNMGSNEETTLRPERSHVGQNSTNHKVLNRN